MFGSVQTVSAVDNDFIDSVRWSEPFIISLVLMQVCIAMLLYFTRRQHDVQFAILVVLTGVTLMAERLNRLGKSHWSSFASQDYFDSNGLFMLVFVTAPFVIYANFIVIRMALRLVKLYALKARRQTRQNANSGSEVADAPASHKKQS